MISIERSSPNCRGVGGVHRPPVLPRIARVIVILSLASCATVTGPRIESEEEQRVQLALKAEAKAFHEAQQARLDRVGARLMKASGAKEKLKLHYVGRPEQTGGRIHPDLVNAWTDGEGVWITRGMMRFLRSDDELAVVLGHEMAHAYRGHMAYLRGKQALGLALSIPAAIFGGQAAGQLAALLVEAATKKFDRDQEREADLFGLIWVHRAGFDPEVAKGLFRRMAIEMPESVERGFLSSHPTSAERLLAMEKVSEALKKGLDPLEVFAPAEKRQERSEMPPRR
ncbi:MAG TPA: M48 family metalloprotease [candidate division Zixibacteria bacterium]|nr:M48 family metalloprotease [candidate division Zixibacteria bacterium]